MSAFIPHLPSPIRSGKYYAQIPRTENVLI